MKKGNLCMLLSIIMLTLCNPLTVRAEELTLAAPGNSNFKAYMDYRAITKTSSMQYKLQQQATTNNYGLRMLNGRYMVAVGTYYSKNVGDTIDVTLSTGVVLPCIVGDVKADKDTDATHRQAANGNVVEFIVDTPVLDGTARRDGTISSIAGFEGDVKQISKQVTQGDVATQAVQQETQVEQATQEVTETPEVHKVYQTSVKAPDIYICAAPVDLDSYTDTNVDEKTTMQDLYQALGVVPGNIITISAK